MIDVKLRDGGIMPGLGLGTACLDDWQADTDLVTERVSQAITAGYRYIDTAYIYANERSIGRAIRNSGIDRDEFFITSKLWITDMDKTSVAKACDKSLQWLGLDVLDLYLVHWPDAEKNLETFAAMQDLVKAGKVKHIGVSNFRIEDLEQIKSLGGLQPVCNQIECHPYFSQLDMRDYCKKEDIKVISWFPLGGAPQSGGAKTPLSDETIKKIADAHNTSIANVIIRWHIQNELVPIPRSNNPERIKSNFEALTLELTEQDMAAIDGLNTNQRLSLDPSNCKDILAETALP